LELRLAKTSHRNELGEMLHFSRQSYRFLATRSIGVMNNGRNSDN